MAKKIFLALLLVTLAAGGAFAQISAGVGGNFAVSFESYKFSGGEITSTTSGGGFYAFLDATYVEADIGLLFGSEKLKLSTGGISLETNGPDVSILTLGLYGKYPIDLGGFTLFPMIGIQMDIGLSAKQNGNEASPSATADYLNRFWVKLGAGIDFNLSEQMYLRPSFLYGINFGAKASDNTKDAYDASAFYHGLDIRVALGFRL